MISNSPINQVSDQNGSEFIDAYGCYRSAEHKAADYYKSLNNQVINKTFVPILTKDFYVWKNKHINFLSALSNFFGVNTCPDQKDYRRYIQWLDYTGKLDDYLYRSISYIFMRDLGKTLASPETQLQVKRMANKIRNHLTRHTTGDREYHDELFSMDWLFRKAQKEKIEATVIWMIEKIKNVVKHIPEGMDAEQAERKLIKIIAGVLMHETDEMGDSIPAEERSRKLDSAIRLGYSYGLTYPFIDDLLDANILSHDEKHHYSELIRTTLMTGTVPELGEWTGKNGELIRFVHAELKEAFDYIKVHQSPEHMKTFFEQAYVFFCSQEVDRNKELNNTTYTNEDLYIPVILKSSSSRLIARSVADADEDSGFDNRTFYYGIYNQLADDFADMYDDLNEGAVTPYTYYMKYHDSRQDLINPFELYWAVISNLIHEVYESDPDTCEVILDRAVNGLKRYKARMGIEKYNEVMGFFTSGIPEFNKMLQKIVRRANDVDFFDKLLRDRMLTGLKNEKAERIYFENTMKIVRQQIDSSLKIYKTSDDPLLMQTIVDAANYSLEAEAKRIRPLIAWVMGKDGYGLNPETLVQLLRSLEYMHTASLIFDDLPSQDNSDFRRGRTTLHKVYGIANAELAGLLLTQKAVEEQTWLEQFSPEIVVRLIRYSSIATQSMCKGQAMDLESKGKQLTLDQLYTICFYKTGIAFEASLIMPAILAQADENEIKALKRFARDTGIAFQIKDDLLDAEGDSVLLGKSTGKDAENNSSTFVTILGTERAKIEMWNCYCNAIEALREIPRNTAFLRQLLNYIVHRDH